jgi:hypothetical protein
MANIDVSIDSTEIVVNVGEVTQVTLDAAIAAAASVTEASDEADRAEAAADTVSAVTDLLIDTTTGTDLIGFQTDVSAQTSASALTGDGSFTFNDPCAVTGKNVIVRIMAHAAGWAHVITHTKSGDNFTGLGWVSRYCAVGFNEFLIDSSELPMPSGCYFSISGLNVVGIATGSGNQPYYNATNGVAGSLTHGSTLATGWNYTDATTSNTLRILAQFEVYATETALQATKLEISTTAPFGRAVRLGSTNVSATAASGVAATNFRMAPIDFPHGGYVRAVDLQIFTARSCPVIFTYRRDGSNFVPYNSRRLDGLAVGVTTNVQVGIYIPPGGRVGVQGTGIGLSSGTQWPGGIIRATSGGPNIPAATSSFTTANGEALISFDVIDFAEAGGETFRAMVEASQRIPLITRRVSYQALAIATLGQSNWTGSGSNEPGPVPETGTVFIWDDATSAFVDLSTATANGQIRTAHRALGKALYERINKRIYFVQSAVGGSAMQDDTTSNNWSASGARRAEHEARWALASAALNTLETAWSFGAASTWQGEADAFGIDASAAWASKAGYKTAFLAFDTWLRGVHGAGIVHGITRIAFNGTASTTGFDQIRAAHDELVRENALISMAYNGTVTFYDRGLTSADNLHHNQTGKNEAGDRMAEFFAAAMVGA